MKQGREKVAKQIKAVHATKQKISKAIDVDAEVVDSKEVSLAITFDRANRSIQDANLRKEQNMLRKQLSEYLKNDFGKFVKSMNAIDDPQIFSSLYLSYMKLFLPRPKDFEGESEDIKNLVISKLFGKKDN